MYFAENLGLTDRKKFFMGILRFLHHSVTSRISNDEGLLYDSGPHRASGGWGTKSFWIQWVHGILRATHCSFARRVVALPLGNYFVLRMTRRKLIF